MPGTPAALSASAPLSLLWLCGCRKTGSNRKKKESKHKTFLRNKFEARHIDQVWEDVRKVAGQVHQPGKTGPLGTTAK